MFPVHFNQHMLDSHIRVHIYSLLLTTDTSVSECVRSRGVAHEISCAGNSLIKGSMPIIALLKNVKVSPVLYNLRWCFLVWIGWGGLTLIAGEGLASRNTITLSPHHIGKLSSAKALTRSAECGLRRREKWWPWFVHRSKWDFAIALHQSIGGGKIASLFDNIGDRAGNGSHSESGCEQGCELHC